MKKFTYYITLLALLFYSCDTKKWSLKRSSEDDSPTEGEFNAERLSNKKSSSNSNFKAANNVNIDSLDWSDRSQIEFNSNQDVIYLDTQWKLISKENFMDSVLNYTYGSIQLTNAEGKGAHKLEYIDNWDGPSFLLTSQKQSKYANFSFSKSPNFIFEDLNGSPVDNSTFDDKVVVLNFWFIGCKGCMLEMPFLNTLVDKYKNNKEILFIASSDDSRSELLHFLMINEFNYRVTTINTKYLKDIFNITMFPTHMIIGKDGTIKYLNTGGSKIATKFLEQGIEKILRTN